MQTLLKSEPWGKAIIPGVILWRPVAYSSISASVRESCRPMHCDSVFRKAPEGGFMARLAMPGCFISDPEIIPSHTKNDKPRRGLVVFIKEMPPENWTHLVVTETTRQIQTVGCGTPGGAIYAKADKPYTMEDYVDFRVRMLKAKMRTCDVTDFEQVLDEMDSIWPKEERDGAIRLIISPGLEGAWNFDFSEDGPDEEDAIDPATIEVVNSPHE